MQDEDEEDERDANNVTNAVLDALEARDGLTRAELKRAIRERRPEVQGSSIRTMLGRMLERRDIRIDDESRFWLLRGDATNVHECIDEQGRYWIVVDDVRHFDDNLKLVPTGDYVAYFNFMKPSDRVYGELVRERGEVRRFSDAQAALDEGKRAAVARRGKKPAA